MDRARPTMIDESRWRSWGADVVVIGGGVIGCAAAAMLADRGLEVILVEAEEIGAGASGRNLGAIQHPFDPVLAPLYHESVTRYRALAAEHDGFSIGREPAGLLLLTRDAEAAALQVRRMTDAVPELRPALVVADALAEIEPAVAPGTWGVRVETGYPVRPASATEAWAAVAAERGVTLLVGSAARPVVTDGRVVGAQLAEGWPISAAIVLVAAGPWTPSVIEPAGTWPPISATWGVTVQVRLPAPAPRHILEEDQVDAVNRAAAATARAAGVIDYGEPEPPSVFSLATAGGVSTIGSTFLPIEPDPTRIEPLLLHRAAAFVPAVAEAEIMGRRLCARPQSLDGRPFIGGSPDVEGLFVCAGHGPWGISTGPASAAIVARLILDGTPPPPELDARRPIGESATET